jgi:hypothetical protein
MNRFLTVIEKAENNCSAYSPDLPGCVTTGKTIKEVKKNIMKRRCPFLSLNLLLNMWRFK